MGGTGKCDLIHPRRFDCITSPSDAGCMSTVEIKLHPFEAGESSKAYPGG